MTKHDLATSAETILTRGHKSTAHDGPVGAIKAAWEAGQPPDAVAALAAHPVLAENKRVVVELAYEEFCRREESGEQIDVERFCERFAEHRTSVYRRLQVHQFVERKLAELVRRHDLRHARYRGRLKVLYQGVLTSLVVNLKRIVRLLSAPAAAAAGTVRAAWVGIR